MWFLFQSAIIVAVVQSNISYRWAERTSHAVMIGVGLAWIATVIAEGYIHNHALEGGRTMKQSMEPKNAHSRALAVWTGLVILSCAAGAATAQIPPRPPMPIPNVVALMPPTVPLTRSAPTPIPPPTPAAIPVPPQRPIIPPPLPEWLRPAMMPVAPLSDIALPPPEFDHEYKGKLTVLKEDNYVFIKHVCSDVPNAVACSFRTYDSVTGTTISCLIMLGPEAHNDARVMAHEIGHCNGWPGDHPGARYGD
jgi:hypothetical protein